MQNQGKDTKEKKITYIYVVTNCYGDPNKVYIGKTKNIKQRENDHKKTYGDIQLKIIDKIESWDKTKWKPIECKWIEHFKQLNLIVLNKNNGGSGAPCGIKRDQKFSIFLSKMHKNKSKSEEHKIKIGNSNKKPKYPGFGKKPENFGERVSKSNLGVPKPKPEGFGEKLSKILKGRKQPEHFRQIISKIIIGNSYRSKPVLQYDLQDNFIKEWSSVKEATDFINRGKGGGIGSCCRGQQNTAYGYKWKWK